MDMPDDLTALIDGLSRPRKTISPKYFYDEAGSQLFEEITQLPEYYLTDVELEIMERHIDEMAALIGETASLIEFGAGSGMKTRLLLEHMHEPAAYVPVDISEEHLLESQRSIQQDFPDIEVLPVPADFLHPFDLPEPATMPLRNVVYFPGSTIGNFERDAAVELLEVMHEEAGEDGALLIGADLRKDPDVIHAAYNDSAGVTARFNLNMLSHLNREFDAEFDVDAFEHRATYDRNNGRVVMELVSQRDQVVQVSDARIPIARDEAITTEYSHKYTLEEFGDMVAAAGFSTERVWTDPRGWFSVHYCTRP
jgi:dimethylhistidine N-methyltransferase